MAEDIGRGEYRTSGETAVSDPESFVIAPMLSLGRDELIAQ
jgi:hypothetical protein